jgi:GNAT superfamily N-acetyltransferase
MKFREARSEDAPAIERLYRILVPGDDRIRLRPERIARIHRDPDNFLFVVDDERLHVCATAFATLCLDPMYGDLPYAVLENIVVDPAGRGEGVGSFLLSEVEGFCRERSCTKIMLLSSAWRGEAHRFFEERGFSRHRKVGFVKYRSDGKADAGTPSLASAVCRRQAMPGPYAGRIPSIRGVLILGAGRFGRLAAQRLGRRHPNAAITVVDQAADVQQDPNLRGCETVAADGIDYLVEIMSAEAAPDWIVPALPIHVAWLWIKRNLTAAGRRVVDLPVPEAVADRVPHPLRGDHGQLYASNADFICPDDCPEPERSCTVTGRPRPVVMFAHLAGLRVPGFTMVVIRSRQLAPGVGGFRPADLREAKAAVLAAPGAVMLATACKCHAVIDAMWVDPPLSSPP